MQKSDICFYFSITKEENSDFDENVASSPVTTGGVGGPCVGGGSGVLSQAVNIPQPQTPQQSGELLHVITTPKNLPDLNLPSGNASPMVTQRLLGVGEEGAANAMKHLTQMAKPMESNLLLPPNLTLRRGESWESNGGHTYVGRI